MTASLLVITYSPWSEFSAEAPVAWHLQAARELRALAHGRGFAAACRGAGLGIEDIVSL